MNMRQLLLSMHQRLIISSALAALILPNPMLWKNTKNLPEILKSFLKFKSQQTAYEQKKMNTQMLRCSRELCSCEKREPNYCSGKTIPLNYKLRIRASTRTSMHGLPTTPSDVDLQTLSNCYEYHYSQPKFFHFF